MLKVMVIDSNDPAPPKERVADQALIFLCKALQDEHVEVQVVYSVDGPEPEHELSTEEKNLLLRQAVTVVVNGLQRLDAELPGIYDQVFYIMALQKSAEQRMMRHGPVIRA